MHFLNYNFYHSKFSNCIASSKFKKNYAFLEKHESIWSSIWLIIQQTCALINKLKRSNLHQIMGKLHLEFLL